MKLFRCDNCGQTLYFENIACEHCGFRQGYLPEDNAMVALTADGSVWASPRHNGKGFVFCANAEHGACNWLIEAQPGGDAFCRACRHNETIPSLDDPAHLLQWQIIERAKKRLFYSLLQFRLPLRTRKEDPRHGLSFRFLADMPVAPHVMTGHDSGVITIALAEADDAERERRRTEMHEPYRTMLGHFRHEIGHHYWDLLVQNGPMQQDFRRLFGDETQDYSSALQRHYRQGAPPGWQASYITAYATSHPWEDFAESWAHYLHLTDTIEMAASFGVKLAPKVDRDGELAAAIDFQPYASTEIGELVENWVPLASLMNNLNRTVGQPDPYPFVLTSAVIEKLAFVQRLIKTDGGRGDLTGS
jgi:hypothetical protein